MEDINVLLTLKGKVAVVTGGAKGIGYGISYRLAEAGAEVVIADLDSEATDNTSKELAAKGWTVHPYIIDISDEEQVKKLVSYCKDELGGLDIFVNNAGIYPSNPISQMTTDQFEKVINVNLRSVFLTTKYASEVMKDAGGGKIINISSIDALHPSMIGLAHYDASKHGVWGFTKNAALELSQYNISVNALAPGGITTAGTEAASQGASKEQLEEASKAFMAKIPMHRMGEPDDIGKVVLFMASDMSSYMTGSQVVVDGGALLA